MSLFLGRAGTLLTSMPDPAPQSEADRNPIRVRVELCCAGQDPNLIARLPSGWAVLTDRQPDAIHGCCMLLPDFEDSAHNTNNNGEHPAVGVLNDLAPQARAIFLTDLTRLGDAVLAATGAEHVNYLILCNAVPALHGHVVPRYTSEDPAKRRMDPLAAYDFPGSRPPDGAGNPKDAALVVRLREALKRI
ncbi:MAG: diadenosine tetraphosphate (Ap4A) HIT family hydrolase [Phycisphaerales bacterium]|jgi:diadenosine tetraphosphate (Ap4A) HIT family hydrolase